ncbi:MAG: hypothetical protein U0792_14125 [Gemmataceae bacterium]
MRKLLSAVVVLFLLAGVTIGAEMTIVKFDKGANKVTVKEGDKEATYTVSDKTKVVMVDKAGKETPSSLDKLAKLPKGGLKVDATVEKEEITEIKIKGGKK